MPNCINDTETLTPLEVCKVFFNIYTFTTQYMQNNNKKKQTKKQQQKNT